MGSCGDTADLGAYLADRAVTLGHDLVRVDRLEVDLARQDEVAVVEARQLVEEALEGPAYRVLDEPRLQVRVLDDEQLVGPLEELVDRRAHRALHDLDEPLRVEAFRRADEERAAPALVVRRERDELEDPLDVAVPEAGLEQPVGGRTADEP